jgi:L-asparaginase
MLSDLLIGDLLTDERKEKFRGGPIISKEKVLVIYTGGTIGSAPKDRDDPESPEIVYSWDDLKKYIHALQRIQFLIDVISFVEPLDSANVEPKHWKAMAKIIENYYDDYNGFVIAHGTDTMVYTASALSFILKNLGKPVIITGSQIPALDKLRNDAEQNLITALYIAQYEYMSIPKVPEVCIFFRDLLIRGNRSKKFDASGYDAFKSLNYVPLGICGDRISIKKDVLNEIPEADFHIQPELTTDVISIDLTPGMQNNENLCKNLFTPKENQPKGIVLKTYGAGNVPTNENFLNIIGDAIKNGAIVINVTQCPKGEVQQGLYDTSAVLQDIGVISGQDITYEAAMCKLMNVLGEEDFTIEQKKELIATNMAGEQAFSMYTTIIDDKEQSINSAKAAETRYRSPAIKINGYTDKKNNIEKILIRFIGAKISDGEKLKILVFINLPAIIAKDTEKVPKSESTSTHAGTFLKSRDSEDKPQTFTFDLKKARTELKSSSTITVYAISDGDECATLSWDRIELTLFCK